MIRQKVNKATAVLSDKIEQLNLINIYRTLYAKNRRIHSFQVHVELSPE